MYIFIEFMYLLFWIHLLNLCIYFIWIVYFLNWCIFYFWIHVFIIFEFMYLLFLNSCIYYFWNHVFIIFEFMYLLFWIHVFELPFIFKLFLCFYLLFQDIILWLNDIHNPKELK